MEQCTTISLMVCLGVSIGCFFVVVREMLGLQI